MRKPQSLISQFVSALLFCILVFAPSGFAQQTDIPSPESVLGFKVGDDYKLANYDESLGYFRRLDAASDYMQLQEVGRTSEGREWYFALISSPENLANVEQYRQISQRLAHPRNLTDAQGRELAREGKAFVHIDGGLHATEAAGAQHTIQVAYELLSNVDDPKIRAILDNVVVLLWPSLNPDGQNIVANWYSSNLGTSYEVAPLNQLYQKYVGHDNNRDAYMLNMIESRVIGRTWRYWEPQITYAHHQKSPFPTRIWLPPFADPIATQVPPLMSRTVNSIGMAIAHGLESKGQVGATHMGTGFDAWYPGYIDYLPMLQNICSFWTETGLYRYATPRFYTINDFPSNRRDLRPETLYPSPWQGGWWRLRDAVDYMVTASISTLDYAAKYKYDLLYNRYQAGRNTIRKYELAPPYAYFVPEAQRDPIAPVEMLRRLAFNGVNVYQLTKAVQHDGIDHPKGTWVIPMNQEFAELARQVLDIQTYPDLREYPKGPPEQPYDAAGWTLPFMMDVKVTSAASPLTSEIRQAMRLCQGNAIAWNNPAGRDDEVDATLFDSVPGKGFDTDPVAAGIMPAPGRITGSGMHLIVNPAENNAFRAINSALRSDAPVRFLARKGEEPSRYLITGISNFVQDEWAEDLALQAERTRNLPGQRIQTRIALYRPWRPSMDEGWTRWLLESYGFTFANIRNADFQHGDLRKRFEVIVFADIDAETILNGFGKGSVPPRYQGGLGTVGVRNLDEFVRSGGTLICMNKSCAFAIEQLHLPVKNVVDGLERKDYFVGASIVQVDVDQSHPVMAGMPARAKVFVDSSPVFTTLEEFKGTALASYQKTGSPLCSGYMLGEKHMLGYAAALDVYHGKGHVILLGFRPQWRGQPFGTFRVLFNAAFYGGGFAARVRGKADFWEAPMKKEKDEEKEEQKNQPGMR